MAIQASEAPRAVAAAIATASALGLSVEAADVLHVSNRLAVRLLPADVLARVALPTHEAAALEVELAARLAAIGSPVGRLDPRVAPRVYERDGFTVTLWTHYEPEPAGKPSPAEYADALSRLHAGMRQVEITAPHFSDRVAEANGLVENHDLTPELGDADRDLLMLQMRRAMGVIAERGATEQLLHGEPHPGNVLNTRNGPLFIDLETACRGPVEFDVAHAPKEVGERYAGIDQLLLDECRGLIVAMVAAWRLDPEDQFPSRRQVSLALLAALRAGPPYPVLGAIPGLH